MLPAWARRNVAPVVKRLSPDRPVYFISDMHLGDGTRTDIFMAKDRALLKLLDRAKEEGARLVIVGDAVDVHQAIGLTRIIKAHGPVLRTISELADTNGVVYLVGNHDTDISLFRDILRWDVADELRIGPDILVTHGHVFDPYIGPNLQSSSLATKIHHFVERVLGTWIRIPLAEFYTPANRLSYWLFHKGWLYVKLRNILFRKLGFHAEADRSEAFATYWVKWEAGDPMGMFRPAVEYAKAEGAHTVICGHAHMPGNLVLDGVRYVNTGSWTYAWAQYAHWDGDSFTVRDWLSGKEYRDELYRPTLDGELDNLDFDRWWRNQYLGWFRFRSGELRRRRTA